MSSEIVSGLKKLIDRRIDDLQMLHLTWFGGEPLLTKDILFDIAEHICCRRHERELPIFSGHLTTNGYLLDLETVERLCSFNHHSAQITLDGLGAVHDRTRPLASGKGSFDRIWSNLCAIKESNHDFHVNIRIHLGGCNLSESADLCRAINREFGNDIRFSVVMRTISDLGGPRSGSFSTLSADEVQRSVKELSGILPDIDHNNGSEDSNQYICYAAKPNSFVIRADGRVCKCTVALEDPRNMVGNLDSSGRMYIDHERFRPWLKGFNLLDSDLLACPYSAMEAFF